MKHKFNPGDRFIHNGEMTGTIAEVCDTYYKICNVAYTFKCALPCKHETFDIAQERHLYKLNPEPKYKVGDLVLYDDMLGHITEVIEDSDKWLHLYRVGKHFPLVREDCLSSPDWRDILKISHARY
jgi:hypothetical protein